MKTPPPTPADAGDQPAEQRRYRLRLFIAGATGRSTQAVANIRAIGEKHLHGRYDLQVVDAYQQPDLVREGQIIVLPTLIRDLPLPLRRLVGDMSDDARVMLGLELVAEETDAADTSKAGSDD